MLESSFEQLKEAVPPVRGEPESVEWEVVERTLGIVLPVDYKQLVEAYGPGSFDDFLWVLHPSSNDNLDMVRQQVARLDALRTLHAHGEALPADLELQHLVAWAITDNGDVCYWSTGSAVGDSGAWPIFVNESRGPEWERFDGTTTDFLVNLLSGRLRIGMFPDDFPSPDPVFNALNN